MGSKQYLLQLSEMNPDSSDYKEYNIKVSQIPQYPIIVSVRVPDTMLDFYGPDEEDICLTPLGLAHIAAEIDLAIQRMRKLRKPEYDAIIDGSYYKQFSKGKHE